MKRSPGHSMRGRQVTQEGCGRNVTSAGAKRRGRREELPRGPNEERNQTTKKRWLSGAWLDTGARMFAQMDKGRVDRNSLIVVQC